MYQQAHGHEPSGARPAIEWAVQQGLVEVPDVDPLAVLASRMARALRLETAKDEKGRRYRVNQSVRVSAKGTQYTLWAIGDFAPVSHSVMFLAQCRNSVIDDLVHLSINVDVHNDRHPDHQYVLALDFAEAVAERRAEDEAQTA